MITPGTFVYHKHHLNYVMRVKGNMAMITPAESNKGSWHRWIEIGKLKENDPYYEYYWNQNNK